MQQNPIVKISEKLLTNFLSNYGTYLFPSESEEGKVLINNISNYFRVLSYEVASDLLYDQLNKKPEEIFKLLQKNNLFSAEKILLFIEKGELEIAALCLLVMKDNYSINDLSLMYKIIELFENLKNTGEIKVSKNLLWKNKEKYICEKGHINFVESKFCEKQSCAKNIRGLTRSDILQIEKLKNKVATLNSLFKQH